MLSDVWLGTGKIQIRLRLKYKHENLKYFNPITTLTLSWYLYVIVITTISNTQPPITQ